MGILNRTPDSFYDHGATFDLDALLGRAEQLVAEGADLLDVGGVKAGPGPEVTEAEELDRVVPAIEALDRRFDVPALGRHLAGLGGPGRLRGRVPSWATTSAASPIPTTWPRRPRPGRRVVATHIRLAPRVRRPRARSTTTWWPTCAAFLAERAERALAAGIAADRIVLDAGLDLGKTAEQSLDLLRASAALAALGLPPAAVGLQQDVPRRRARSRHRPSGGRPRWPRRPSGSPSVAGCCGSTTWPAPGGSATPWPPSRAPAVDGADPERRARSAVRGGPVTPAAVYLVRGDDPSLVAQAARALLGRAGGRARPGPGGRRARRLGDDDLDVGAGGRRLHHPPFLIDRRVVVVRDAGRLDATDAARLVAALEDPCPRSSWCWWAAGARCPRPW